MTTNPKGYVSQWLRNKRQELIQEFGGCCNNCGSKSRLEFAHIKATQLNGMSRGRWKRVYDIIKNKDSYTLLCHNCHEQFDSKK